MNICTKVVPIFVQRSWHIQIMYLIIEEKIMAPLTWIDYCLVFTWYGWGMSGVCAFDPIDHFIFVITGSIIWNYVLCGIGSFLVGAKNAVNISAVMGLHVAYPYFGMFLQWTMTGKP